MTRVPGKIEKQMIKQNSGATNAKKRGKIDEDIGQLAVAIQQLGQAVNQISNVVNGNANEVSNQLANAALSIEALVSVLDIKDKFQAKVKEIQIENVQRSAQSERDQIKKAVEDKTIVTATKITDSSLLCVGVKKADGSACYPTFSYELFESLKPELQAVLKDKEVGSIVTAPTNGKVVEVLEVYEKTPDEPATEPTTETPPTQ